MNDITRTEGVKTIAKQELAFFAVNEVLSGYESGFKLVAEAHPDAIERFVVVHHRGLPRLLLPTSQKAMRVAITSFRGASRNSMIAAAFVRAASTAGGPFSSISSSLSMLALNGCMQSPLRALISSVMGRNDFRMALRLSYGRPNAKTVAVAISDDGEVLCYAKFGAEALTNDLVEHEGAVLKRFEGTDMPVIMPRCLYSGTWADNRNVLITAPLHLTSIKHRVDIAHKAADAFAMQTFVMNSSLSDSAYWQRIVESVKSITDDEAKARQLRSTIASIEKVWGNCKFDFGASHGDWTHANLGLVDGELAALDWERCIPLAPRGIDVAHFAVCENSFRVFKRALDVEQAATTVRKYLISVDQCANNAHPLVLLALLEMVTRFLSARRVGIRSDDLRFGPALSDALKRWSS